MSAQSFHRFLLEGCERFLKTKLVEVGIVASKGDQLYMCFGTRAFYLVDFNPEPEEGAQGGTNGGEGDDDSENSDEDAPELETLCEKYFYAWIDQVVTDVEDGAQVMIQFKEQSPLILSTFDRQSIIDELHIGWKTDYQFRKWRSHTFPLKQGRLAALSEPAHASLKKKKHQQHSTTGKGKAGSTDDEKAKKHGETRAGEKKGEDSDSSSSSSSSDDEAGAGKRPKRASKKKNGARGGSTDPADMKAAAEKQFRKDNVIRRRESGTYHFGMRRKYKPRMKDAIHQDRERAMGGVKLTEFTVNGATIDIGDCWEVIENPERSVVHVGTKAVEDLRLLAEQHCHNMANNDGLQRRIVVSRYLTKRENAGGDTASYLAWTASARNARREFYTIVVRRSFIPPVGSNYQDIVFRYTGRAGMSGGGGGGIRVTQQHRSHSHHHDRRRFEFADIVKILDSIQPIRSGSFYDDTAAQARSLGMLYSVGMYNWFERQDFAPSLADAGQALFKSIVNMVGAHTNTYANVYDASTIERGVSLIDDPFDIINDMNADAPGLSLDSPRELWVSWREKVARYLAFAVDGGILPELVTIEKLAQMHVDDEFDVSGGQKCERLLDYFLHVRRADLPYDRFTPTGDKLLNSDIMSDMVFNENVMTILLRTSYLEHELGDQAGKNAPKKDYVAFLHFLLRRSRTTVDLAAEALHQLALLSKHRPSKEYMVDEGVVATVVNFIKVDHPAILLAASKTLVNITEANDRAKAVVVLEGTGQYIVQRNHLIGKDEEIVKCLCSLIKNCTSSSEKLRQKLARDGVSKNLVELMRDPGIDGMGSNEEVVIKAAAALWNLCGSADGRDAVTAEGGAIALVQLLLHTDNELVVEKGAGALMMLCATYDSNKVDATNYGIVRCVIRWINDIANLAALRNLCGLLAVLTSEKVARDAVIAESEALSTAMERAYHVINDAAHRRDKMAKKMAAFINQLQSNLSRV